MRADLGAYLVTFVCACATLSLGGCRQNPPQRSPEVRVAEAVDAKLVAWRRRRATECHRAALAEAQLLADTLIMDYALAKRLELARPSRPIRPEEPPLLRPDDTLELAPFRTDTLILAEELPRRRRGPARVADAVAVTDTAAVDTAAVDTIGVDSVPVGRDTVGE